MDRLAIGPAALGVVLGMVGQPRLDGDEVNAELISTHARFSFLLMINAHAPCRRCGANDDRPAWAAELTLGAATSPRHAAQYRGPVERPLAPPAAADRPATVRNDRLLTIGFRF